MSAFPRFNTHLSADIDTVNSLAQIPGNADKQLQNTLACLLFHKHVGASCMEWMHTCAHVQRARDLSEIYIKAAGVLELVLQYTFQP